MTLFKIGDKLKLYDAFLNDTIYITVSNILKSFNSDEMYYIDYDDYPSELYSIDNNWEKIDKFPWEK